MLRSLLGYCRDWLVLTLPIRRLPTWIVKGLYGSNFKFAFLVHPRSYQDVFISMPVFKILKFFIPRKKAYRFFSKTSPFVLNTITTSQNTNGYVIAQLTVPEIMFEQRRETLKKLEKMLRLVSKICEPDAVVGLGGWFPMVTKRGALLKESSAKLNITVTNGHCGTLASIYMTIERIARVCAQRVDTLTIAIIGVGKMGSNVARAFNGSAQRLILIDINLSHLNRVKKELMEAQTSRQIDCVVSDVVDKTALRDALRKCHVGVCATSSFRNILKLKDLPKNFVGIDDSRPEALPRDLKKGRIILEGGLLRIADAHINYNYGFGEDDNVFGCLGEAFLLALDEKKSLAPTLGDVDMKNFFKTLHFCKKNGVSEGDFKTSHVDISEDDIKQAVDNQDQFRRRNESTLS